MPDAKLETSSLAARPRGSSRNRGAAQGTMRSVRRSGRPRPAPAGISGIDAKAVVSTSRQAFSCKCPPTSGSAHASQNMSTTSGPSRPQTASQSEKPPTCPENASTECDACLRPPRGDEPVLDCEEPAVTLALQLHGTMKRERLQPLDVFLDGVRRCVGHATTPVRRPRQSPAPRALRRSRST